MVESETFNRLCRAREMLRETHDPPLTVQDVARETRLSPYHFIRRFAALFGETPHQFRQQARIEHAKHLLAVGPCSVTEVCLEVGFTSLGSFSDLFARRVGVAPSVCRRRVRTGTQVPGRLPDELIPGCLTLMGRLPAHAAIFEKHPQQGIPISAFEVDDMEAEFRRLKGLGVVFTKEPTRAGPVTIAIFSDTCGNLIQLYQRNAA